MSKKPWEDKVSDEELEEVVDADFLDDEDEFEDYEEEEDVTPSDEKTRKGGGFINSSFLTVLLDYSFVIVVCILFFVFYTSKCRWKQNCGI